MNDRPQKVEIVIPLRTMMSVLAVAGLIALAILSLDTLLAVFIASILALGLDPVVSALVRHGWKRGPAALFVFFVSSTLPSSSTLVSQDTSGHSA